MAKIGRLEDVEAWKKARELTRVVYGVTKVGEFARDFSLKDQIRRASVSVMSNIAEGFERGGNKEFIQFLATAKGSVGEVQSLLYVALDAGFITQEQFDCLYNLAQDDARLIGGFMKYLKTSGYVGRKYK